MAHAKSELSNVREELLPLDLDDTDEVVLLLEHVEEEVLNCSLHIKRLTYHPTATAAAPPPSAGNGVRLTKLAMPRFDGNIINWITFWEQFCVSIQI